MKQGFEELKQSISFVVPMLLYSTMLNGVMKMFLLQMAGYPGSGKSTLSKKIAKTTGAIVIDRDVIKSSLIVSDVPEKLLASAAHNVLFELARFYLKMKLDVILDCPCYYELTVNRGADIANKCEAKYKYIECRVEDYSGKQN